MVTLTGSGGYLSGDVNTLFEWEGRTWSLVPVFLCPSLPAAQSWLDINIPKPRTLRQSSYRQQVLVAFASVENSLSGIKHLADQFAAQQRAVTNSLEAANLAEDRYRSGVISYIEVVDANRDALTAERAATQLTGLRFVASIRLIKALGGGFDVNALQVRQVPAPKSKGG